ncbi:hypothetical protein RvY_01794 [Ramazzottius varieornatus]|uniref:Uncharacterized protein n=1 Tax=Ramazzottius varieornatus TaxID=947166 RepID=A0A1D1UPM8_RAMVA|nr:hypothetical protein RvY_01794 [Ramazzottius varieornatus]
MAQTYNAIAVDNPEQPQVDWLKFFDTRNVLFTLKDFAGGFSYWNELFFFDFRRYSKRKNGYVAWSGEEALRLSLSDFDTFVGWMQSLMAQLKLGESQFV